MNGHHYFAAIKLPQEVKDFLKNWTEQHKEVFPFNRWVYYEDYHITLAFIGSIEEEQGIETIVQKLKTILNDKKSFPLILNKIGTFGPTNKPRIFWVDVEESEELLHIQEKVFSEILNLGFKLDTKPFRPHITLARKWASKDEFNESSLTKIKESFTFTINEVVLYETHLDKLPKYHEVASFKLK